MSKKTVAKAKMSVKKIEDTSELLATLLRVHDSSEDAVDRALKADEKDNVYSSSVPRRELLQNVIGPSVKIKDLSLYLEACTHKSAETANGMCQERMEHLGDAILSAAVTDLLFSKYTLTDEGVLSRLRTKLVNGVMLASIGRKMGIERILIVGPTGAGAFHHDKVYEDTLEALVAAVYCDLGFDSAKTFVKDIVLRHVDPEYLLVEDNYKEVLRRFTVKNRMYAPSYASNTIGNETECTCTVYTHEGAVEGYAKDSTKRKAEMEASKNVLLQLGYDIYAESIL